MLLVLHLLGTSCFQFPKPLFRQLRSVLKDQRPAWSSLPTWLCSSPRRPTWVCRRHPDRCSQLRPRGWTAWWSAWPCSSRVRLCLLFFKIRINFQNLILNFKSNLNLNIQYLRTGLWGPRHLWVYRSRLRSIFNKSLDVVKIIIPVYNDREKRGSERQSSL